jgi:hypothetical protein
MEGPVTRDRKETVMAEVSPIPQGMRTVTPNLVLRDCAKAIEFYENALGAQESRASRPQKNPSAEEMRRGGEEFARSMPARPERRSEDRVCTGR